jgi:dihydrolipoamide dehydrogenase
LRGDHKGKTIQGHSKFSDSNQIIVSAAGGHRTVSFMSATLTVGSAPIKPLFIPDAPRIMDSKEALLIADFPAYLLVLAQVI